MTVRHVVWDQLSEAERAEYYPSAVRSVFGAGDAPLEVLEAAFLPPMVRLESVQVEITTWCNLHCQQCIRTKRVAENAWTNRHIPLDDYTKIIRKLPRAERVILQGVGEPSMHPHFEALIATAQETGKYGCVAFNTNGHARDEAYWRAIAARYRCAVSLSVDSLDPVIARVCRAGTDAELLRDRVRLFAEIFPAFSVTLVASKLNWTDIPATLRGLAELGCRQIGIQGMISTEDLALGVAENAWLATEIAAIRRDLPGMAITGGDGASGISVGLKRCVAPFVAPFIMIDGILAPCCAGIDPEPYEHTSLLDDRDWDEVRSSEPILRWFRSYVREDPELCSGCSFNPRRSVAARSTLGATRT